MVFILISVFRSPTTNSLNCPRILPSCNLYQYPSFLTLLLLFLFLSLLLSSLIIGLLLGCLKQPTYKFATRDWTSLLSHSFECVQQSNCHSPSLSWSSGQLTNSECGRKFLAQTSCYSWYFSLSLLLFFILVYLLFVAHYCSFL